MNVAVEKHTTTRLQDGKVLVAGGFISSGNYSFRSDLYDPAQDVWLFAGNMGISRALHTATLLNDGRVLAAGGFNVVAGSGNTLQRSDIYNPATGWSQTGSLATARIYHTATLLQNGRVLVIGGVGASDNTLASAEIYNPVTGLWAAAPNMSRQRAYHTATLLADGRVLVAGGFSQTTGGNIPFAEIYNPTTNSWSEASDLNFARQYHTASLLSDGKVLVAGGVESNSFPPPEIYDPTQNIWSASAGRMLNRRWQHTATTLNDGRILIAGGLFGSDEATGPYLYQAEIYDPVSITWFPTTNNLITDRATHGAALLSDGRVLITGGKNRNNTSVLQTLAKAEAFTLGQGSAVAFAPAVNLGTFGNVSYGVAIGDFNGDAKPDLVDVQDTQTAALLLGTGTGGFGAATSFSLGTAGANSVAIGDLNGDGKSDLAVAGPGDTVAVLLGTGTGGFGSAANFFVGANNFASAIAIGDFNSDTKPDLAVANFSTDNVSILLGSGSGSFGAPINFPAGTAPSSIAIGDFNGDGNLDLAVANSGTHNVSILLGSGTGNFGAPLSFPVGTAPNSIAIGDFNGDGKTDLAVANLGTNNVSILLGGVAGAFGVATNFVTATFPVAVAIGDLNGDGKLDLAVASDIGVVSVLLGTGTGGFGPAHNFFAPADGSTSIAIGDLNGDGKPDLAVGNFVLSGDNISVYLNTTVFTPTSDLMIANSDSPDPVRVDGELTYVLTATNKGPSTATGVVINNALPANTTLLSAIPSQGTCSGNPVITCNLGSINPLASAKITILVRPTFTGGFSNLATVAANETDPNSTDNSITTTTTVLSAVNKPITVTPPQTLPQAQETLPYTQELPIAAGTPVLATVVRGTLPLGLRLEIRTTQAPALLPVRTSKRGARKSALQLAGGLTTVVVTGTPTAVGTQVFTVLVEDELGRYYQRIKITVCPTVVAGTPLTLCDSAMGEGEFGVPYRDFIGGAGGSAPYFVEHIGGALPDGLVFTFDRSLQQGIVAGPPTLAARTSSFTVRITDAAGTTITKSLTLPIVAPLNAVTKLGTTRMNRTYSARLKSNAGLAPIAWKATNLPPGLIINEATGVISGRAQTPGNYNVTVQATDSLNKSVAAPVRLNVVP